MGMLDLQNAPYDNSTGLSIKHGTILEENSSHLRQTPQGLGVRGEIPSTR
jgi:hypothetical protein